MRKWNESEAISTLTKNDIDIKNKFITGRNGLKGLKACSAYDFLCSHCGYRGNLRITNGK